MVQLRISVQFPITKEAYFYRSVFNKHYPQVSAAQTVRKWIPNGKKIKIQAEE
jgi:hypothetical protein